MTEASAKPAEPLYTFTFPKSARVLETDPETVTFRALTLEQDLHGNKLAADGNIYQKVELALFAFDGKPLNWSVHEGESRMAKLSPKCRELLLSAFMSIHIPKDDERADFLASIKVAL